MGAAGRPPPDEENMSASANKIATAHRLLPMCASYVVVLMLGLPAAIALADSPPKLNVAQAATRPPVGPSRRPGQRGLHGGRANGRGCSRAKLVEVRSADKTQCVGNVKTGGPASYVELLSCLEIMRDAKAIRQGDVLAPSDRPSG